jgi:hypothetical protein
MKFKRILFWVVVGVFAFLVGHFIGVVSAETIPFDQCIKVVDSSNGSILGNLNCTFSDTQGVYNDSLMSFTGVLYCFNINYSYPSEVVYDFVGNCTDGSTSEVIHGDFYVDPTFVGGPVLDFGEEEAEEEKPPLLSYLRSKPLYALAGFICVGVFARVFWGIGNRRKKR